MHRDRTSNPTDPPTQKAQYSGNKSTTQEITRPDYQYFEGQSENYREQA